NFCYTGSMNTRSFPLSLTDNSQLTTDNSLNRRHYPLGGGEGLIDLRLTHLALRLDDTIFPCKVVGIVNASGGVHRGENVDHRVLEGDLWAEFRHVAHDLFGAVVIVVGVSVFARPEVGHTQRNQVFQRHADQINLIADNFHRGLMEHIPIGELVFDQIIRLADAARLANHANEAECRVFYMQELDHLAAIPTHDQRLALAHPVNPLGIAAGLTNEAANRAVCGRGLDDRYREFFVIEGRHKGMIGFSLAPSIGQRGQVRMIFGHRHPQIGLAIGHHAGTLDKLLHTLKGAYIAFGIVLVETDHINCHIELFALHGRLKCGTVVAVAQNQARTFGRIPAQTPVITGDFVPLLQQQFHDADTDIAGSPDDDYAHCFVLSLKIQFAPIEYPTRSNNWF